MVPIRGESKRTGSERRRSETVAAPVCARPGPRARQARALGATLLVAAPLAFGARAHARSPSCDPAQHHTLVNGIEVLLLPDAALPAVAVVSSIHVGSRDDPPGYAGLAHYVEHLTFREAGRFASAFDLYAEAGATEVNAATSVDTTDFYAVLPAAQLERGIWTEARRLAIGLDGVTEQAAREERGVLLREFELRYGYAPGYRLLETTMAALYPGDHPYHSPLASEDSLSELTLTDARWFFARYYQPRRVRLVLVGDFRHEVALTLIERHFGGLEPRANAEAPERSRELTCARYGRAAPAPSSRRIVLRSRSKNELVELYWPVLAEEQPERWRGLFRLLESELENAVRQAGLARAVQGDLVQRELGSFWVLAIDPVPGRPLDDVVPLVQRTVSALAHSPSGEPLLAAQRQALELWQALDEVRLLARARNLARRECTPAVCLDAARQLAPSALEQIGRFDPSRALIVEHRYKRGAADEGHIQTWP
jgi:predicted Zn-dependent peptidase